MQSNTEHKRSTEYKRSRGHSGRRCAPAYALLIGGMAWGMSSFAAPPTALEYANVTFPKGTENCQSFIRGGGFNSRRACNACCQGTVDPDKKNIPVCVNLCERYADPTIYRDGKLVMPDGSPAPTLPRKPRKHAQPTPAPLPKPVESPGLAR